MERSGDEVSVPPTLVQFTCLDEEFQYSWRYFVAYDSNLIAYRGKMKEGKPRKVLLKMLIYWKYMG